MLRKLLIYVLADCSASMFGEAIESVTYRVRSFHAELMSVPCAVSEWVSKLMPVT